MTTNKYCGTTSETVVIETDICCTNVDTATTAYLGSAATADDVMAAIENVTAINSSSATLIKEVTLLYPQQTTHIQYCTCCFYSNVNEISHNRVRKICMRPLMT